MGSQLSRLVQHFDGDHSGHSVLMLLRNYVAHFLSWCVMSHMICHDPLGQIFFS